MATDKQNEVKVPAVGEKKASSSDGGLGLESILDGTERGHGSSRAVSGGS